MSEDRDGAAVRIPPPFLYLAGVAAGWLLQRFALPLPLPLGPVVRVGAPVVLGIAALAIMGAAAGMFRKTDQDPKPWKPTPSIVTTGIYRCTRNPMYVSMAMLQAVIGMALSNGWILILIIPVLALVHITAIRHEEAYLERKFGETYLAYKRSVRRWI